MEVGRAAARFEELLSRPGSGRKRLAYVHVPFCANHCLFCGFYRRRARADEVARYAELVIAELEREASAPAVTDRPVHAVYLGGGTPSALSAPELGRLLAALRSRLPLAPDCEITVEGRVAEFDAEKIDACLEAGANRFSIGVQTFDTDVRRRQGRRASREEVVRFLAALRDRDRAAVVLDLLIGLPGQTREVLEQDLEICLALEPDGLDLYALNVLPGTPLQRAVEAGRIAPAASLPEIGASWAHGVEILRDAGWRQISNSHFARTTRERNLYNLLIKQGAECLAYGAGASGALDGIAYAIEPDHDAYAAGVEAGRKPLQSLLEAGPRQPLRDAVIGGMEQGRLALDRLDPSAWPLLEPLAARWHALGLLVDTGPIMRLTVAGRFWAPNLTRAILEHLAPDETPFPAGRPAPLPNPNGG